jgi:glycosyltransferase involved in cell wall biosynthesis
LRWVLAGARPDSQIMKLARDPRIEVHGDVDDLTPFLERARIAIAPMATGSGVPMKVLEAWAAGVPVVAHPQAAAGLDQGDQIGVAVADTADQWLRTITELLSNPVLRESLVERGRTIWSNTYSPVRIRQAIRDAIARAL